VSSTAVGLIAAPFRSETSPGATSSPDSAVVAVATFEMSDQLEASSRVFIAKK